MAKYRHATEALLQGDLYHDRVAKEKVQWDKRIRYVALLEKTPDFNQEAFQTLRRAENIARSSRGIPNVGEGCISETAMVYRLRALLAPVEVVHHGRLPWLGAQHLDVYIPSM